MVGRGRAWRIPTMVVLDSSSFGDFGMGHESESVCREAITPHWMLKMRWFFWRHKPSSKTEERGSLPESRPEKITVVIQDSNPTTAEARGVIVTSATQPARERWSSRHHRRGNFALLQDGARGTAQATTALPTNSNYSRKLRRSACCESLRPDRLAYFTRGNYTSRGLSAIRLAAPAVASWLAQPRAEVDKELPLEVGPKKSSAGDGA